MSIHDILDKIKGTRAIDKVTIMYLLLVVGVGTSAFGLGRLSVDTKPSTGSLRLQEQTATASLSGIEEHYTSKNVSQSSRLTTSVSSSTSSTSKNFVASKHGKLYYPKACKGANRIKPENEVWFSTATDAEKAGYTSAPSCK